MRSSRVSSAAACRSRPTSTNCSRPPTATATAPSTTLSFWQHASTSRTTSTRRRAGLPSVCLTSTATDSYRPRSCDTSSNSRANTWTLSATAASLTSFGRPTPTAMGRFPLTSSCRYSREFPTTRWSTTTAPCWSRRWRRGRSACSSMTARRPCRGGDTLSCPSRPGRASTTDSSTQLATPPRRPEAKTEGAASPDRPTRYIRIYLRLGVTLLCCMHASLCLRNA
mmetsp:Transcript_45987/g.114340  ORF Transcript_45987/g.114340 Transcript_45987/m.114340 type:complete len:225 (+) Transcript_45987:1821-2495(+)